MSCNTRRLFVTNGRSSGPICLSSVQHGGAGSSRRRLPKLIRPGQTSFFPEIFYPVSIHCRSMSVAFVALRKALRWAPPTAHIVRSRIRPPLRAEQTLNALFICVPLHNVFILHVCKVQVCKCSQIRRLFTLLFLESYMSLFDEGY